MKKLNNILNLVIFCTIILGTFGSNITYAQSPGSSLYYGYFTGYGPHPNNTSYNYSNVLEGCGGNAIPNTTNKKVVIDTILDYLDDGNPQSLGCTVSIYNQTRNKIGASFIVNTIIGAGANKQRDIATSDWRVAEMISRINNPAVSLSVSDFIYGGLNGGIPDVNGNCSGPQSNPVANSGFMQTGVGSSTINDDGFFINRCLHRLPAIHFYYNSNLSYVLKLDCGNPMGSFGGLPDAPDPIVAQYRASSSVTSDYEKGGNTVTFNHIFTVLDYPCDLSQAIGADAWVSPALNWNTSGWSDTSGTSKPIGDSVNAQTIEFSNCGSSIRLNSSIVVPLAINTQYTLDYYTITNSDISSIITEPAGTKYSRQLTVDGIAQQTATFTVTEAPYAQFKGNDVRVCGDGANNRFVWDNRPPSGNDAHGSYGEYATIFSANNSPNSPLTGYQGLNSYKSPPGPGTGTRNDLETLWTTSLCPTFSYAGLSVDSSENFKEEGSWYIDNDVLPPNTDTATPANLYTVKIFYAKKDSDGKGGNIYIAKNVTKINAILIAEGNIYTCAEPNPAKPGEYKTVDQVDLDGECNQPLVINGAIMADQVHLMRASGTRFLDNGAAEVINYPWQLHHATSPLKTTDINDIDAIIDLPPRL